MSIDPEGTKALCFDLGNTLIAFGPRQIAHQYEELKRTLETMFGPCDSTVLKAVRDRELRELREEASRLEQQVRGGA